MIRQSTIDKLHDLRLSAMSDAFECQCRDPETYQGLSFEDRFGMLVDKEWLNVLLPGLIRLFLNLSSLLVMTMFQIFVPFLKESGGVCLA